MRFGTDLTGRLLEVCRCGERPVPLVGAREHGQRGRLELYLREHAKVGLAAPNPKFQRRPGGSRE